jgi:hypothetical protein
MIYFILNKSFVYYFIKDKIYTNIIMNKQKIEPSQHSPLFKEKFLAEVTHYNHELSVRVANNSTKKQKLLTHQNNDHKNIMEIANRKYSLMCMSSKTITLKRQ